MPMGSGIENTLSRNGMNILPSGGTPSGFKSLKPSPYMDQQSNNYSTLNKIGESFVSGAPGANQ
jgi:hypothetical protein